MKEFIGILVAISLLAYGMFEGMVGIKSRFCKRHAEYLELSYSKYDPGVGCLVSTNGVKWIPVENIKIELK